MSNVNILFALKDTHFQALKDNFRFNEDGSRVREDLTVNQAKKLRHHVDGHWPTPTIGGTVYHVISWTIPMIWEDDEDHSLGLKWVNFLDNKWPAAFILIGAWERNGCQLGTSISLVENGVDVVPVMVPNMVDKQVIDVEATIADGTQVIYKIVQVQEGWIDSGETQEVPHFDEVVEGTPIYPLHPQYMKIMPDVDGQPATVPVQVNKVCGWADRRWS